MSFLQILPLAFVMMAGPQIITSFFLATSERWAANAGAYVAGAAIAVTILSTAAYVLGRWSGSGVSKHPTRKVLDTVLLAVLVAVMAHVSRTRQQSQQPKWMIRRSAWHCWDSGRRYCCRGCAAG